MPSFPPMFVSSLRELPENYVYRHGELNCFIEYLHRKLLAANFLSYDIESTRTKMHLLDLRIKTIFFLFYNYAFNSSQKLLNILLKYMINIS